VLRMPNRSVTVNKSKKEKGGVTFNESPVVTVAPVGLFSFNSVIILFQYHQPQPHMMWLMMKKTKKQLFLA
jgi:hypothetical protein